MQAFVASMAATKITDFIITCFVLCVSYGLYCLKNERFIPIKVVYKRDIIGYVICNNENKKSKDLACLHIHYYLFSFHTIHCK